MSTAFAAARPGGRTIPREGTGPSFIKITFAVRASPEGAALGSVAAPFLLDTAASNTVISRELATALDLQPTGPLRSDGRYFESSIWMQFVDSFERVACLVPVAPAAGTAVNLLAVNDILHRFNVTLSSDSVELAQRLPLPRPV
ncbi:MAG: aspartyl protease family protein [Gemmataceae bacterium]